MEENAQNKNNRARALWLQCAANGLSYARMAAAPLLFARIARGEHRSWKTAAIVGLLAVSDYVDGKLARKAVRTDPSIVSEHGAWADQMADKALTHALMGGLAVRAIYERKPGQAAFLIANEAVQATRDIVVTNIRKEAAHYNVSTRAQWAGKVKAAELLASLTVLTSPLANNQIGEMAGLSGIAIGTGLSVTSGVSLANSLHEGIAVAQQLQEEARPMGVPPEIENSLA